jgi:hypothetical protein
MKFIIMQSSAAFPIPSTIILLRALFTNTQNKFSFPILTTKIHTKSHM